MCGQPSVMSMHWISELNSSLVDLNLGIYFEPLLIDIGSTLVVVGSARPHDLDGDEDVLKTD